MQVRREKPYPHNGPKTVDLKYLGPVRRLFDFLASEDLLGTNPAAKVHSAQKEVESAKSKRDPLKVTQFNAFLASTTEYPVTSSSRWMPLMMLFSGARPNELAQLQVDDLRLDFNGRPHLNLLTAEDGDGDTGPDAQKAKKRKEDKRSIKTAAGRRMISIHPVLIEMGLLDLFDRRRTTTGKADRLLLNDVKCDAYGHYGREVSRRLNRRLRAAGITNKRISLYSLRHTFCDACVEAGMHLDHAHVAVVAHLQAPPLRQRLHSCLHPHQCPRGGAAVATIPEAARHAGWPAGSPMTAHPNRCPVWQTAHGRDSVSWASL